MGTPAAAGPGEGWGGVGVWGWGSGVEGGRVEVGGWVGLSRQEVSRSEMAAMAGPISG